MSYLALAAEYNALGERRQALAITVVPSFVTWGDEVLRDRGDIQPEELCRQLETDAALPRKTDSMDF
jgi:fatty acid-binding protein DegV